MTVTGTHSLSTGWRSLVLKKCVYRIVTLSGRQSKY